MIVRSEKPKERAVKHGKLFIKRRVHQKFISLGPSRGAQMHNDQRLLLRYPLLHEKKKNIYGEESARRGGTSFLSVRVSIILPVHCAVRERIKRAWVHLGAENDKTIKINHKRCEIIKHARAEYGYKSSLCFL
jgi:hypothetical protein